MPMDQVCYFDFWKSNPNWSRQSINMTIRLKTRSIPFRFILKSLVRHIQIYCLDTWIIRQLECGKKLRDQEREKKLKKNEFDECVCLTRSPCRIKSFFDRNIMNEKNRMLRAHTFEMSLSFSLFVVGSAVCCFFFSCPVHSTYSPGRLRLQFAWDAILYETSFRFEVFFLVWQWQPQTYTHTFIYDHFFAARLCLFHLCIGMWYPMEPNIMEDMGMRKRQI